MKLMKTETSAYGFLAIVMLTVISYASYEWHRGRVFIRNDRDHGVAGSVLGSLRAALFEYAHANGNRYPASLDDLQAWQEAISATSFSAAAARVHYSPPRTDKATEIVARLAFDSGQSFILRRSGSLELDVRDQTSNQPSSGAR